MPDLKLYANFLPRPMTWDDGSAQAVILLRRLSEISIFDTGWEILGTALDENGATFLEKARTAQQGEGSEGGLFFIIAENARGPVPPFLRMESYFATIDFDRNQGRLAVTIDLRPELATIDTVFEIIKRFAAWSPLQHVSTTPATYAEYDAPIDHVRRRGIGWAGWVPFQLTQEQVPEAAILEPVENGTFLATQRTYWAVQDREAVRRAQALELRLNDLGMLPTRRVLSRGTWGTTEP